MNKKYKKLILGLIVLVVVLVVSKISSIPLENNQDDMKEACLTSNGNWLNDFKECEYVGKEWCDNRGGKFDQCASACRHEESEVCTKQCVSVCQLKEYLIAIDKPIKGEEISSPLNFSGKARGYWFFEGSFPVILTNWDGLIIAEGIAKAQSDWMIEDFVPFKGEILFEDRDDYSKKGFIIFQKDNPSGLPEFDDALEMEIFFK